MLRLEDWFTGGERIQVQVGSHPSTARAAAGRSRESYHIFTRVQGEGPWLTLLHGFPTCSWDWAKIAAELSGQHRLLLFDFLGFGDSDKPAGHSYSLFEQAEITQALWHHFGVERTGLVAHDYGATVALELLAREAVGELGVNVPATVLMNAGLYVDLIRPVLLQRLLRQPGLGMLLSRLIGERAFSRQFASIFAGAYPISARELHQHWQAIARRDGVRNYHRLIRYLDERQRHKTRWETTLETTGVPLRFIWGLEDPVSGAQIARQIRQRNPAADILELDGVGHYPQLEVPEVVADEVLEAFKGG